LSEGRGAVGRVARSAEGSDRFFILVAGLNQLLMGLALLLVPWWFIQSRYDRLYSVLPAAGALLALSGLALLTWWVAPLERARLPQLTRLLAAVTLGPIVLAFVRTQSWSSAATYAAFAAAFVWLAIGRSELLQRHLRTDLLVLVVGVRQVVLGLVLLILPAEFIAAVPELARAQLSLWGAAMLCSALLLALSQVRQRRTERLALLLLATLPMLGWIAVYGVVGRAPLTIITTGLMAAGLLLCPFVPASLLAQPRLRLATKLTAVAIGAFSSALVLLAVVLLQQTQSAYQQRAQVDLTTTAQDIARATDSFVNDRIQQATLASRDPEVTEFDPALQFPFMARVLASDPALSQIGIVNQEGVTVARSPGDQTGAERRGQPPGVQEVLQTHQPQWDIIISSAQQVPVLAVRVPIYAPDGRFIGVYVNQVRLTTLTRELGALPLGHNGRLIIVDAQGKVIVHPDPGLIANRADLHTSPPVAAALAGQPRPISYSDGDTRWFSVQAPVPGTGWTVVVERPESVVLAPAYRAREEALAALTGILLLMILGAVLFARHFSRPLVALAGAAHQIGEGDEDVVLPPAGKDEVGDLVRAFAEMQQRLSMRTRERTELLVREQSARGEVEALLAATASLSVQAEPEAVLRTLVEQAAMLLEADRAIYAVLRDDALAIPAVWQQGIWADAGYQAPRDGILWWVWQRGKPYLTNDTATDRIANPSITTEFSLRSQLSAPLIAAEREKLGLISLNNSRRPGGFTEQDQRLLVAICEAGAAVLLRARDIEVRLAAERAAARRKQEVEALLDVADRMSTATDPDEVTRRLLSAVADVLNIDRVGIATNEGDHALSRGFWEGGVWVANSPARVIPLEGSSTGWVIRHARPYRTGDLPTEALPYRSSGMFQGSVRRPALSVPLISRDGTVVAVLHLRAREGDAAFTEEDEQLAAGIAHQGAIALERARLIQELRSREERLQEQAMTDPLTGLPNRRYYLERLEDALAQARDQGTGIAVLFLDLDGFKVINDSLGHSAGDSVLKVVARVLVSSQPSQTLVARFGGDEFAILVQQLTNASQAIEIAERVLSALRAGAAADAGLRINASVGVAYRSAVAESRVAEELVREADIALYRAKATGKGHTVLFTPEMNVQAIERLRLQADLQYALERRELKLYYQPIVDLADGSVLGVEALLRWVHPRRGVLTPDAFLAAAEETGLILPIGEWTLREACRQARAWQTRDTMETPLRMSVNLSVQQVQQADLVEQVSAALRESGLEANSLELELTENALLDQGEVTLGVLAGLKELGVRLAIDDFGTGYSSLSYLQRLDVDTLKIDQSFIHGLRPGSTSAAIVQAVCLLSHALDVSVVAEGIETAEEAELVTALGCDFGQGWHYAAAAEANQVHLAPITAQPGLSRAEGELRWTLANEIGPRLRRSRQ
jgi:diguanylate cyclase (GGDEF)-like protein